MLVALPAPVQAKPAPVPVTPTTKRVPLLAPANPALGRDVRSLSTAAAVPGARGQAGAAGVAASRVAGSAATARLQVLGATAVQRVPTDVAVIGLTWRENTGTRVTVQYRTLTRSTWGPWQAIETDPTRGEPGSSGARAGTDPIVVTSVSAVQARVLGPAGGAPVDAALEIIDPGQSAYDGVAGSAGAEAGAAQAAAGRPAMNSRASWGANEAIRRAQPSMGAVKGVVVHHTAGTNNYTPAQVPAILRGIYAFHVKGRKWNDIAYNALVDKWGRVWEGRYGGLEQPVAGAHTLGYNGHTMGISMMGDYGQSKPSTAALDAIARIIAWKASIHQFTPNGATNLYGRRSPVVVGHRNVGQTTCPGTYLYAKLPWIRSRAAALSGYLPSLTLSRDIDHGGGSDVLALDAAGRLQVLGARWDGTMAAPRTMGAGWSAFDQVLAAGDVDSDGDADILARHAATGRLLLYANTSRGGLARGRVVGVGWSVFTRLVAPGDVTGDGRPDLIGQSASGDLRLYPGNGKAGFLKSRVIATGLPAYRFLVGVGDWEADRTRALIGVTADGAGYLLRGVGPTGIASTVRLDGDFSAYQGLTGVSDTDGDGMTELFAVDSSGSTWLGRRSGSTSVSWSPAGPSAAGLTVFSG